MVLILIGHFFLLKPVYHLDENRPQSRGGILDYPPFLLEAILRSEDKRFFSHHGVDWWARLSAMATNLQKGRIVRGASTISEQVVRIQNKRPRTFLTKWLETIEASLLEAQFSKSQILGFYLEQVPYGGEAKGVKEAAHYYFSRSLETLSFEEMLALAVLLRSPSKLYQRDQRPRLLLAMKRLCDELKKASCMEIPQAKLSFRRAKTPRFPFHLEGEWRRQRPDESLWQLRNQSLLDESLQAFAQKIMDQQLKSLETHQVSNGGLLVLDTKTKAIKAWVVAGELGLGRDAAYLDPIRLRRQPGSTLKPFLYSLALDQGHSPLQTIDDQETLDSIGSGIHQVENYSHIHYGPLVLRDALANSLNAPAVRLAQKVGLLPFYNLLQELGLESLAKAPSHYGVGLALGVGEVTLFELTRAYAAFASGWFQSLSFFKDERTRRRVPLSLKRRSRQIISDILSDPKARRLEFGDPSGLSFEEAMAVKTGTSSDYRDAWLFAYNDAYTIGIWFGNLTGDPMEKVTGSMLAPVVWGLQKHLFGHSRTQPFLPSAELSWLSYCQQGADIKTPTPSCLPRSELATTWPRRREKNPRLVFPKTHMSFALDPRKTPDQQAIEFKLEQVPPGAQIQWYVNDELVYEGPEKAYAWPLRSGNFQVYAYLQHSQKAPWQSPLVSFSVRGNP